MDKYNHREVEKKWQKIWQDENTYTTVDDDTNNKYYILVEFPYPSGNLHVGHWYAYSVPDIYARFMRMNGKNVLFPIGFDAFGLPAENAAIKRNVNPADWTKSNIDYMKNQIKSMGGSYDWSREVVTCNKDYYKWTQWLFIQLFKAGIAYRDETEANWCSSCKTVLANEQVLDGKCERCGTEITKKKMPQWRLEITKYADRLIDDLDELDWPEEIKTSQKNWIGRSKGARFSFDVVDSTDNKQGEVEVFTTRIDTIFGVTYLVLSPEHELVDKLKSKCKNIDEINKYIKETKKKTERDRVADSKEKTGVKLEDIFGINPINGEKIPVFIADYVLSSYGTGAVMAVPAHDDRDYEFAKKFNLDIKQVIAPVFEKDFKDGYETIKRDTVVVFLRDKSTRKYAILSWKGALSGTKTVIMGGIERGQTPEQAAEMEMYEEVGIKNARLIKRLRWIVESRYCACHKKQNRIAVYNTFLYEIDSLENQEKISREEIDKHDLLWIQEEDIEKELTVNDQKFLWEQLKNESAITTDKGVLINSGEFDGLEPKEAREKIAKKISAEFVNTYKLRDWGVSRQRYWGCPIPVVYCKDCGYVPEAENNLPIELPEVSDYLPNDDGRSPLAKSDKFVHTTCPNCEGDALRETDTLDTFVDSSWYFLRYCDPKNEKIFADRQRLKKFMPVDFYSGGAEHTTMHLLYSRFFHKALYDLELVNEKEPFLKRLNRGLILGPDGNKMSKSKGNVIDPDDIVEKLGADTMRLYLAFIGPYNEVGAYPWNPESIVGVRRFIERVWKLQEKVSEECDDDISIDIILHKTLKQVTDSISNLKMNTGVSALMSCINNLEKQKTISNNQMMFFVKMLAPYAPHISEELWQILTKSEGSVHLENWDLVDDSLLKSEQIELVVQVNGKLRAKINIDSDIDSEEIKKIALSDERIKKYTNTKEVRKIIVVKNKLVNIVV